MLQHRLLQLHLHPDGPVAPDLRFWDEVLQRRLVPCTADRAGGALRTPQTNGLLSEDDGGRHTVQCQHLTLLSGAFHHLCNQQ